MTVEEVVKAAIGRLQGITDGRFMPRPVLYDRIGRRQQQLFSKAAREDAEFFGTWAEAAPDSSYRLDLDDLDDPIPAAARVTRIEIKDPGDSGYIAGQEVHIATVNSAPHKPAPRVVIRNRIIEGWLGEQNENDLKDVTSLRVYYPKMTHPLTADDAATTIELPEPWTELLVLDLAMYVIRRAPKRVLDPAEKQMALEEVAIEHGDLMADFEDQLTGFKPKVSVTPTVW